MDNAYQWVPFYEALADKLLTFKDRRSDLFESIKKVASGQPLMKYLHFESKNWWKPSHQHIDPFSVIGVMNRGTTDENRTALAKVLADTFDIKLPVPNNVYIIGTMNTADRSIALIDTALRRRFSFVEMQPESATLTDVFVDGIDIVKMLDTLNKRITVLLGREHTIGHSYLLPLKDDPTIESLAGIFENKIIPLLQEYFYDDYEKIQLVLGDNQKPDDSTRFIVKKPDAAELFGNADIDFPEYYEVNSEAFKRIGAYAYL